MAVQEPAPAPGEELSIALALVNTRVSGTRGVFDRLSDATQVDLWLRRRRLLETDEAEVADRADLIQLREDARVVLEAVEHHREPERRALERVNAEAAEPVHPVLEAQGSRLGLRWAPTGRQRPAARVARDLMMFAVSPDAIRIRTCAADDCDRMFVQDHGRRIWCSPGCGNRMRVQRHAARARAGSRPATR